MPFFALILGFVLTVLTAAPAMAWDLDGRVASRSRPNSTEFKIPPQFQRDCGRIKNLPGATISSEGSVAEAVVWLEPLAGTPLAFPQEVSSWAPKAYRLNQNNCEFHPHVLLAAPGVPVYIHNSDPILHNVAISGQGKALANVNLPKKDLVFEKRFTEPGPYLVQCGIHPWMSAVIFVQKHPLYALTGPDGKFRFSGLPEGRYTLHIWHKALGGASKIVTPETPDVEILFPGRRS